MPSFSKKLASLDPAWPLRIGLGLMFLYSGWDMLRYPGSWTWAVPNWFEDLIGNFLTIEAYLRFQALVELSTAITLLAWFLPRRLVYYFSILATVEIAGILILGKTGVDSITFRDIGILGASVALAVILSKEEAG